MLVGADGITIGLAPNVWISLYSLLETFKLEVFSKCNAFALILGVGVSTA